MYCFDAVNYGKVSTVLPVTFHKYNFVLLQIFPRKKNKKHCNK